MNLRFCESEIDYWANRYTECQSASGRERENQVIGFRGKIQEQVSLTEYHLYKVADWVLSVYGAGAVDRVRNNSETHIELTTRRAFTVTDDWEKLMTLTGLSGIRQTTASAILHLYDKEQYPILSGRALWSVEEPKRDYYPDWFWLQYIQFCRDIANRNSVSMRHLDRALWRFSFEQGTRDPGC